MDEDVHHFIAVAVRLRGWDALTTLEAGCVGQTDADQIQYATNSGFAVLTYNVRDFARLHYEMATRGEIHGGIILGTRQLEPRANLRALLNLLSHSTAESLRGQLAYLNNWA